MWRGLAVVNTERAGTECYDLQQAAGHHHVLCICVTEPSICVSNEIIASRPVIVAAFPGSNIAWSKFAMCFRNPFSQRKE
jgi:hypothetical protein